MIVSPQSLCSVGAILLAIQATPTSLAGSFSDNFDDGSINAALWAVGGSTQIGFGGIGSWSVEEVLAPDGHIRARIQGPATANTYGQEAWIRTQYNYNDGASHVINFRWGADVNAYHIDGFQIAITNGSNPIAYNNFYDSNGMWQTDNSNNTRLYAVIGVSPPSGPLPGQTDLPPVDWSIRINGAARTATLYQGPNLTGPALPTMPLDPNSPWYVRFYQMDASSAGYPGTDNSLYLYSYSSDVPAPTTALVLASSAGLIALPRRRRW